MRIETIQIKRGSHDSLCRVLRGEFKPKDGEPVFELDTGKLKFGDGIHNYEDLEYFKTGDIEVEDAIAGQILIYNAELDKWEPKSLADNKSIEYGDDGLQLAGFDKLGSTGSGSIPVANAGEIVWQQAVSQETLNAAVFRAEQFASNALRDAGLASTSAQGAATSAQQAQQFRDATAELISKKFWFGTRAEYETEIIGQGKLTEGTIYFIRDYDWTHFTD